MSLAILIRIWSGVLGSVLVLHSILGHGSYRWGLYDIDDDSDIPIRRRIGRIWEAIIGLALIFGAIFADASRWDGW